MSGNVKTGSYTHSLRKEIAFYHSEKDGLLFVPTPRWDSYDSRFIEYADVKKTYSGGITDEELKAEIFETLDICDLSYQKHDWNYHHDIFFAYIDQLAEERGRR